MSKRRTKAPGALSLYAGTSLGADRGIRRSAAEAVHRFHAVQESAPATLERTSVTEASVGGATATKPGRLQIRLIRAGWSINGNLYTAEVLRRDGPSAWPRGTLCFADHDSDDEEQAHPSGSVKNLAGVLTSDARWDEAEQALFAEAQLFAPWREPITEMASSIGMSIRAWVTGEHGEREGREGFIVQSIPRGRSVDFVTVPAAGGAIVSVLEAVGNPVAEAANLGAWLESRLHLALTTYADEMYGDGRLTREERLVLSSAIGDGLQAWTTRVQADAPQLFTRSRWSEPEPPGPADTSEAAAQAPTEPTQPAPTATAVTETVTDGAPPSAPSTTPTEEEPVSGTQTGAPPEQAGIATVPDAGQPPTITAPAVTAEAVKPAAEAQAPDFKAMLAEALKPFQEQVAAMQAANEARTVADRTAQNRQAATEAVTTALRATEHADVTASIASRVTARVVAAVPTTAEGAVDGAKLTELIGTVVADEAEFVRRERANALAEAGVGLPYGMGGTPAQESVEDDGLDAELNALFSGSLGLSSEAARVAAKGRG